MGWNNLVKLVFLEYVNESQDIKVFLYNWYFCKIVKKRRREEREWVRGRGIEGRRRKKRDEEEDTRKEEEIEKRKSGRADQEEQMRKRI